MDFAEFQSLNGFTFNDSELLKQALTHRSFLNENPEQELKDNERLEFLGDAVLDFVTADMLFARFPDFSEGRLTRLRAALVRNETLAELGRECGIGEALLMGKGEEASGGRTRRNNLSRAFEAVIGALYLDQGVEAVRVFALSRFDRLLDRVLQEALDQDARSRLQEWSQAERNITPLYRTVEETGPDHSKEFLVEVTLGDEVIGRGTGRSKQSAAQSAAKDALSAVHQALMPVAQAAEENGERATRDQKTDSSG